MRFLDTARNRKRHICIRLSIVVAMLLPCTALALDNGMALTPPMGWNGFNGNIWRVPTFKAMIDAALHFGLNDVGYEWFSMCYGWSNGTNINPAGQPAWNATGYNETILYTRSKGLHGNEYYFGDYTVLIGHEQEYVDCLGDAGWDLISIDNGCSDEVARNTAAAVKNYYDRTGKGIILCINGSQGYSNYWRVASDLGMSWQPIKGPVANIAAVSSQSSAQKSGPGGWNHLDIMLVGCGRFSPGYEYSRLTHEEMKTHFSMWCMVASPLLLSQDLRSIYLEDLYIIKNTELIAVDQDSLGKAAWAIKTEAGRQVWARPLSDGTYAVALYNPIDGPVDMTVAWSDLAAVGYTGSGPMYVRDLWEHKNLGSFASQFTASVPAHGTVVFKARPGSDPIPEPPHTWFDKPPDPEVYPALPKTNWTATGTFEAGGEPKNMVDNDIATYHWVKAAGAFLQVDMGSTQIFDRIVIDGDGHGVNPPAYVGLPGSRTTFELTVSDNGTTWRPVASGEIGPKYGTTDIRFAEQTARHFKIVFPAFASEGEMIVDEVYAYLTGKGAVGASKNQAFAQRQNVPASGARAVMIDIRGRTIKRTAATGTRMAGGNSQATGVYILALSNESRAIRVIAAGLSHR